MNGSKNKARLVLMPCLFGSTYVTAVEVNLQPRLNTGPMYYEFEQEAQFKFIVPDPENNPTGVVAFGPSSKVSFSDVMPFVGGGATLFIERFFIDAYAQAAFDGEDQDTLQRVPSIFNNDFENRQISRKWDRQEYSFSAGYALTDSFALFAGYRFSRTDFEDRTTVFDIGSQETSVEDISLDYEQDGPFIGGSYQVPVNQGKYLDGSIGLNLGIAFVDGKIKQTLNGEGLEDITGDTVGVTLGLAWKGRITNRWSYLIGVDGYRFEFEADQTVSDPGDIQGADFSETVVRGTFGLSYLF
ncbi:MAG: hypothetical protein WAN46_22260 [Gammaproteobacteria bacterium]